jgi:hypothetical protein
MKRIVFIIPLLIIITGCSFNSITKGISRSRTVSTEASRGQVESLEKYGASYINNVTVNKNVTVYGATHIDNAEVKGNTAINGAAHITDALLNTLTLHGAGNFTRVMVSGHATVHGALDVKDAVFSDTLTLAGSLRASSTQFNHAAIKARDVYLDHCTAQSLEIDSRGNNSSFSFFGFGIKKDYPARLVLKSTMVDGDVTFLGKEGTVELDSKSAIKGRVINGVVIKK